MVTQLRVLYRSSSSGLDWPKSMRAGSGLKPAPPGGQQGKCNKIRNMTFPINASVETVPKSHKNNTQHVKRCSVFRCACTGSDDQTSFPKHKLQQWCLCSRCSQYLCCFLLQAVQEVVVFVSGLVSPLQRQPTRVQRQVQAQLIQQLPMQKSQDTTQLQQQGRVSKATVTAVLTIIV